MPLGITFTETMRGQLSDGVPFEFTATITSDNLDDMLANPNHQARIDGTMSCPALSATPLNVANGVFKLLVRDPTRVNARLMTYEMVGAASDGKRYRLDGHKVIQDDKQLQIWADTTTLFITVTDVSGPAEKPIGTGILHILPADFAKQLTTMRVTNAANPIDALNGLVKFGMFFAGELWETYGGVLQMSSELQTDAKPRARRALRLPAPEVYFFDTNDATTLRLTRFKCGKKGPVVLAPGFGTSTLAYTIDTVDTNLPEALGAAGYDVWLFDYRASPDLASAQTQFTLDDIAQRDYPAAIAKVREVSAAADVQVMAHCVGSMTFLMAMLSGLGGVRSAISSALTLYPVSPIGNRIRAGLDLGQLLVAAHVETLTTDFDKQKAIDVMIDNVLKLFPSKEQCTRAVCRRVLGIYGDVYKHLQLNDATHDAIHEMFGVANVRTFNHLSLIVRTGHVVDKDGNETYMTHLDRLAIPITFIHGAENNLFLPEGSLDTLRTVSNANDAGLYQRIVFPNYAHMDCYIGKNASADVFPTIVAELDRFN